MKRTLRRAPAVRPTPRDDLEPRNDRELVYAARVGDDRAFDALFYRYRDGVYRLSLAITKDPQAAEEVVLDTFARAYRALARLEPDDTLRPWLYRVAINESYDRRPRGVAQTPLDLADELAMPDDGSPARMAERAEDRRVVLAAVGSLDDKHRTVVVLHYLNELPLAEIGHIVGAPVGTVKSRLHYALKALRVHLAQQPGFHIEPAGRSAATGEK
ncbi:MAG: RNA polymerase sigma factor [Chloroflexota bacterium]|nr:RNA polymerase sigma factor [Chloroflexota bacterium]MDE3192342.1 RNA polymerase sigma factor [Chloroflexota bacterium]